MRPRRTPHSNKVLSIPNDTEDSDLWVIETPNSIMSVWELSDEERKMLLDPSYNIQLTVLGSNHPPVALSVTKRTLGKGSQAEQEKVARAIRRGERK